MVGSKNWKDISVNRSHGGGKNAGSDGGIGRRGTRLAPMVGSLQLEFRLGFCSNRPLSSASSR